jgi:hypothetical protein
MGAERRKKPSAAVGTASNAAASPSAAASAASSTTPRSASGWKWYHIYYTLLCSLALLSVSVYLACFRSPYVAHPSYDPLTFLPHATRNQMVWWYKNHQQGQQKDGATTTAGKNDLPALLAFLLSYQSSGHFDSALIRNYDHYLECMTQGWIAGVMESVTLEPKVLQEIAAEEQSVGSIPGGSRRLRQLTARAVSPIVELLYEDPDLPEEEKKQKDTPWGQLTPEHRVWVYEGLSHCHTTPCRLAKMQLMTLWREKVDLYPEHAEKDQWNMLTQLFHPETHPYALLDAPPSADALGALWLRFFSTGSLEYIQRVIELTRITGAKAYREEKDKEIRAWSDRKHARAVEKQREQYSQLVEAAQKSGETIPPEPKELEAPKLPESPTKELHDLFFNSLLYHQKDHPEEVGAAFRREWSKWPGDQVIVELEKTKPFRITATV